MNSKTILLSGATGFLGSHLAEDLSKNNYKVLALIRSSSDLWRLNEIKNENLALINLNEKNFKENIQKHSPDFFIHAAWQGVGAEGRNNAVVQTANISFTTEMLTLANELKIKKIISFGSQAE
ncbi:MAG: NAD-dependent epimerase/dehydratase family protein, partial [Bacteroidota bacterium]